MGNALVGRSHGAFIAAHGTPHDGASAIDRQQMTPKLTAGE
jgi:hypothetical protein